MVHIQMDNQQKTTYFSTQPVKLFGFNPELLHKYLLTKTHHSSLETNIVSMALQGRHGAITCLLLDPRNSNIPILEKIKCLETLFSMNELIYNFFRENTIKILKKNIDCYLNSKNHHMTPTEIDTIHHTLSTSLHKEKYGFVTDGFLKKLTRQKTQEHKKVQIFTPSYPTLVVKINVNSTQEHNGFFKKYGFNNFKMNK